MKSHHTTAIANLLTSPEDSAVLLALALLKQHPVYSDVLIELLYAVLTTANADTKRALTKTIDRHAPALFGKALRESSYFTKNQPALQDELPDLLYFALLASGLGEAVVELAVLVYQKQNKGLEFLQKELSPEQFKALLMPRWNPKTKQLDLSRCHLRGFPKDIALSFEEVEILDLRGNNWVLVLQPELLEALPNLRVLYLQAKLPSTQASVADARRLFPQLTILT